MYRVLQQKYQSQLSYFPVIMVSYKKNMGKTTHIPFLWTFCRVSTDT